jgi:hypothetical protein
MTGGRLSALTGVALPALVLALGGCAQSGGGRTPDSARLPLAGGAKIVTQVRQCDRGANAFCALELVIVDPRAKTSNDLLASERRQLRKRGWTLVSGDTGEQNAAESPGHELRVTYATAYSDLKAVDLGWIQRSRRITLALSRSLFGRASAISMMLEVGSS